MSKTPPTKKELVEEISCFRQQQQSLLLATCNPAGEPLASYAPFAETAQGELVLLLSDMAEHSQNLKHHINTKTPFSILFIEDEAVSRNIFARKRLSYQCLAEIVYRDDRQWPDLIAQLQQKLGKTIELLGSLGDFRLYVLQTQSGNFVKGFGQAYPLNKNGLPILNQE